MKITEEYFCVRVWCDPKTGRSRFKYMTDAGGWKNCFEAAKAFASRADAQARLRERSGSIFTGVEILASDEFKAEVAAAAKRK